MAAQISKKRKVRIAILLPYKIGKAGMVSKIEKIYIIDCQKTFNFSQYFVDYQMCVDSRGCILSRPMLA